MKIFVTLFFGSIIISGTALAQCVVYTCEKTGAFGGGYNNDNTPTSFQECTDMALKTCREKGGTHCELMHQSDVAGWWAIAMGNTTDDKYLWQGVQGEASQYEAEQHVKQEFAKANGFDPQVFSWYVYSNVKY